MRRDSTLPVTLAGFRRAAHIFGRSALMLSGGATLGFSHLGVVKALFEHDLLLSAKCLLTQSPFVSEFS